MIQNKQAAKQAVGELQPRRCPTAAARLLQRHSCQIQAVNNDAPGGQLKHAEQGQQHSCLAAARAAHNANLLFVLDVERQAAQRQRRARKIPQAHLRGGPSRASTK